MSVRTVTPQTRVRAVRMRPAAPAQTPQRGGTGAALHAVGCTRHARWACAQRVSSRARNGVARLAVTAPSAANARLRLTSANRIKRSRMRHATFQSSGRLLTASMAMTGLAAINQPRQFHNFPAADPRPCEIDARDPAAGDNSRLASRTTATAATALSLTAACKFARHYPTAPKSRTRPSPPRVPSASLITPVWLPATRGGPLCLTCCVVPLRARGASPPPQRLPHPRQRAEGKPTWRVTWRHLTWRSCSEGACAACRDRRQLGPDPKHRRRRLQNAMARLSAVVAVALLLSAALALPSALAQAPEQCAFCSNGSSGVCQHLTDGTCWEYVPPRARPSRSRSPLALCAACCRAPCRGGCSLRYCGVWVSCAGPPVRGRRVVVSRAK